MDAKWKHRIAYGITLAIGLVGLYLTIKLAGKSTTVQVTPADASNSQPGGTQVGTPDITIIGGTYPLTWNTQPSTQATDGNGLGASGNNLYLPVITNYNSAQNGGCSTCAQSAPDALYASEYLANSAITAAMLSQMGYFRGPGGKITKGGYFNLTTGTNTAQANQNTDTLLSVLNMGY